MSRYEELLSLYLDGEPSETELTELATLLKGDERLAEDFREELLIWEAWSQEIAPERSEEAFLAGLHTRLRAEKDAPEFELSVTKQLKERRSSFRRKPIFAIAAVLVVLLSLGYFFNPADISTGLVPTAEAGQVHIHGECVCTRCTLKNTDRCRKAIRYTDAGGNEKIIRLVRNPELRQFNKCFCGGPTIVDIEGELVEENGEQMLAVTQVSIQDEKKM